MRPELISKLNVIKKNSKKILDLGAGRDQNLRDFFVGLEYTTLDLDKDSGADIIGDAHHLPIQDNVYDAVIAFSILEHTHSPHLVVSEIQRVLKPGGYVLLCTPFIHPYHGGRCPDYYRFTKEGLEYLFREFTRVEAQGDGGLFFALKYFVPKSLESFRGLINPVMETLDTLFTRHRSSSHEYTVFGQK